jgi:histidinol dehydrogenase
MSLVWIKAPPNTLGEIAATLADGEGLQAHAQSARYRINNH